MHNRHFNKTNTNLLNVTYRMLFCRKINWTYLVEFAPHYFIFKVSFTKFPVKLSIDRHSIHTNEQFGGCLIKRKQILSI